MRPAARQAPCCQTCALLPDIRLADMRPAARHAPCSASHLAYHCAKQGDKKAAVLMTPDVIGKLGATNQVLDLMLPTSGTHPVWGNSCRHAIGHA